MAVVLTYFKPSAMLFHRRLLIRASLFLNFCVLTYVALQAAHGGNQGPDPELSSGLQIVYNGDYDPVSSVGPALSSLPSLQMPTETETESSSTLETSNAVPVSTDTPRRPDPFIQCSDKDASFTYTQRGTFWILNNYVPADRYYHCDESVTYTTHGDVSFLDNLIPLVKRWEGPLSMSVYTPGSDYETAISSIAYLRQCTEPAIKERVTFHLILDDRHFPQRIRKLHPNQGEYGNNPTVTAPNTPALTLAAATESKKEVVVRSANGQAVVRMKRSVSSASDEMGWPEVNCSLPAPWSGPPKASYKQLKKLTYPVNVLRNVARQNAQTHYILASDSELYPSPRLASEFLSMIRRNDSILHLGKPKVFVLPIFEVYGNQTVPATKTELVSKLNSSMAVPFHQKVCSYCHSVPKSKEWLVDNVTEGLHVFHVGKRHKPHQRWEPIYIGTQDDPLYDERLTWEGKSDKMTQGYILCMLDYDFMILDNAFLVHRPGVKQPRKDPVRDALAKKQSNYIRSSIYRELKIMYGARDECVL